jgi:hypothetical protein
LPEDVIRSEAGAANIWSKNAYTDDRPSAKRSIRQPSKGRPVSKLEELGRNVAVEKEVLILLAAVLVHAATGMPMALIAQVKRVMFGIVGQFVSNYV